MIAWTAPVKVWLPHHRTVNSLPGHKPPPAQRSDSPRDGLVESKIATKRVKLPFLPGKEEQGSVVINEKVVLAIQCMWESFNFLGTKLHKLYKT